MGIDWDTPLHGNLREEWIKLFEMLVLVGEIKFTRSTKPEGVVGSCVLVCYFDRVLAEGLCFIMKIQPCLI